MAGVISGGAAAAIAQRRLPCPPGRLFGQQRGRTNGENPSVSRMSRLRQTRKVRERLVRPPHDVCRRRLGKLVGPPQPCGARGGGVVSESVGKDNDAPLWVGELQAEGGGEAGDACADDGDAARSRG